MKRWIPAGLALLLCLTMAGCASSVTPEERFEAVMQKNAEISSMECVAQSKIRMGMGELSMAMEIGMDMAMNRDGDRVEMSMKQATDIDGQKMEAESYYKDGYFYGSSMGQKFKIPLEIEEMMGQLKAQNLQSFSAADLGFLKMDSKGKDCILTYSLAPDRIGAYFDQVAAVIGADTFPPESVTITSVNGRLTVDEENRIQNQTLRISVRMELGGQTMNTAAEIISTYQNVGGPVTVQFPNDLDSYPQAG